MYKTFLETDAFQRSCEHRTRIDFWALYEQLEINDDDYNCPLYDRIEEGLENWAKNNTKMNVWYNGDLIFEFESEEERDRFDEENGDPMAFKLTYA